VVCGGAVLASPEGSGVGPDPVVGLPLVLGTFVGPGEDDVGPGSGELLVGCPGSLLGVSDEDDGDGAGGFSEDGEDDGSGAGSLLLGEGGGSSELEEGEGSGSVTLGEDVGSSVGGSEEVGVSVIEMVESVLLEVACDPEAEEKGVVFDVDDAPLGEEDMVGERRQKRGGRMSRVYHFTRRRRLMS